MDIRKEDERLEEVLNQYLDRNLYTIQNGLFPSVRNTSDRDLQVRGVDITFHLGDTFYVEADEKMAVRYINKNLTTFGLELKCLNRKGKEMEGWFINKKMKNTHYVLGWILAKKDSNISLEDILQVEVAIVSKDKIKAYINEYFDLNRTEYTYSLLKSGVSVNELNNKMGLGMDKNSFILFYSPKLREKPLNILLKKEKYIELADKYLIV